MGRKTKLGRSKNSVQNKTYINTDRRRKNKIRKLMKHLIAYPEDAQAEASLNKIERGQRGVNKSPKWKWKVKPPKVKGASPYMYRVRIES